MIEQIIGDEAAAEAKDDWLYDNNLSKIESITIGPSGAARHRHADSGSALSSPPITPAGFSLGNLC